MNEAELADANHRLAYPPEFDLADSDRLGLFIVGRLAERRGIEVQLTSSPYGGARALVLIPLDFIAGNGGIDFEQTGSDEVPAEPEWRPAAAWRTSAAASMAAGPAATPGPAPSRTSGVSAPDTAMDSGRTDGGAPELPRRVRQANLVPQLRRDMPGSGPAGREPVTTRPPEETRSLMASLQQGWQRGREEQDPDE
jgi:hypothetical protein